MLLAGDQWKILVPSSVGASQQKRSKPDLPESSSSAGEKPSYHDDEFCILYPEYYGSHGRLKKETIEKLRNEHPGIFDGFDTPDDLFEADPVKYQPLAKLIHDTPDIESILEDRGRGGNLDWNTRKVNYGIHKYGFYKFDHNFEGWQWIDVDYDKYETLKKT